MDGCVVLHSGGQDSTTCLLLARESYGAENVYPVSFLYDQSHAVEVVQANRICRKLEIREPEVLTIQALKELGGGALTNSNITIGVDAEGSGNVYAEEHNLPSTVIPGRNVVFLALAAAYGAKLGVYNLMTGGCLADYEGYPDCRPEFYRAMEAALREALDDTRVTIITPLTQASKAETFRMAEELGELSLIVDYTHTCYRGEREMHDWGAGCGTCPACTTRADGWNEFLELRKVSA